MKEYIRKIPLVLLLIWPYTLFVLAFIPEKVYNDTVNAMSIFLLGMCGLCILSVVNAIFYKGEDISYKLAFWSMVIKLVHIPFYVFIFICGIMMLPASLLTILVVVAWAVYLMLFVIDYIFLLSSSAYTIKAIWTAKKQGKVRGVTAIVLTFFSFIFVTDIICAIIIYIITRKYKKREPVIGQQLSMEKFEEN
ncbi:MAG: hypothetical protein IJ419_12510 [Agathobacter sp.]|nr:hypothetical protein [Agathobacter sp.]